MKRIAKWLRRRWFPLLLLALAAVFVWLGFAFAAPALWILTWVYMIDACVYWPRATGSGGTDSGDAARGGTDNGGSRR